jgi:hypothetical protein
MLPDESQRLAPLEALNCREGRDWLERRNLVPRAHHLCRNIHIVSITFSYWSTGTYIQLRCMNATPCLWWTTCPCVGTQSCSAYGRDMHDFTVNFMYISSSCHPRAERALWTPVPMEKRALLDSAIGLITVAKRKSFESPPNWTT